MDTFTTAIVLGIGAMGAWAIWGSVREDNDRGMVWEVFDLRTPEVNLATSHTEIGARVRVWLIRKTTNGQVWADFARAGEGW